MSLTITLAELGEVVKEAWLPAAKYVPEGWRARSEWALPLTDDPERVLVVASPVDGQEWSAYTSVLVVDVVMHGLVRTEQIFHMHFANAIQEAQWKNRKARDAKNPAT